MAGMNLHSFSGGKISVEITSIVTSYLDFYLCLGRFGVTPQRCVFFF